MVMCVLLVFFLSYLVLNVLENYYRDQEKFNIGKKIAKTYQRLWKHYQFMQWVLVFIYLFILITLPNKLLDYVKLLHLLAIFSLFWTLIYDGGLNSLRGKPFFNVSTQTESWVEKNISLLAKIVGLISALITYILIW